MGGLDGAEPNARRESLEPSRPVFGTPETIADRLLEYSDAGFMTVIVEMPAPYDRETLERLAREVGPMVARKPV